MPGALEKEPGVYTFCTQCREEPLGGVSDSLLEGVRVLAWPAVALQS